MLDHFPALVHAELDEIATAGGTDQEETGHARFVDGAEHRPRVFAFAGEADATGVEEFARGIRAEFEEDQLRGDARDVAANVEIGVTVEDFLDAGVEVDGDAPRGLPREHFASEDLVGAGDLRSAHDQAYAIFVGEGNGDFERGVAGADDEDVLVLMLGGIDEAVEDVRQIVARHAEPPWIALRAHGQDDALCLIALPRRGLDRERVAFALERLHVGAEGDVQLLAIRVLGECAEDRFARAGLKGQIAARGNHHRLGHDELARLVAVDRVGEMIGALEENVRQPVVVCMGCRGETGRAGADDGERVGHGSGVAGLRGCEVENRVPPRNPVTS